MNKDHYKSIESKPDNTFLWNGGNLNSFHILFGGGGPEIEIPEVAHEIGGKNMQSGCAWKRIHYTPGEKWNNHNQPGFHADRQQQNECNVHIRVHITAQFNIIHHRELKQQYDAETQ